MIADFRNGTEPNTWNHVPTLILWKTRATHGWYSLDSRHPKGSPKVRSLIISKVVKLYPANHQHQHESYKTGTR